MGETIFALAALIAIILVCRTLLASPKPSSSPPKREDDWRIIRSAKQPTSDDGQQPLLHFTVGTETKAYDTEAYRFGGFAYPEYRIAYADSDGVITERDIFVDDWYSRDGIHHLKCWCFLRDEKRQFRSDRILSSVNLSTNRKIKDIVAHKQRW